VVRKQSQLVRRLDRPSRASRGAVRNSPGLLYGIVDAVGRARGCRQASVRVIRGEAGVRWLVTSIRQVCVYARTAELARDRRRESAADTRIDCAAYADRFIPLADGSLSIDLAATRRAGSSSVPDGEGRGDVLSLRPRNSGRPDPMQDVRLANGRLLLATTLPTSCASSASRLVGSAVSRPLAQVVGEHIPAEVSRRADLFRSRRSDAWHRSAGGATDGVAGAFSAGPAERSPLASVRMIMRRARTGCRGAAFRRAARLAREPAVRSRRRNSAERRGRAVWAKPALSSSGHGGRAPDPIGDQRRRLEHDRDDRAGGHRR